MKKTILTLSIILATCVGVTHGQAVFKKYGFNKKPLTLSKGKYNEFFTNDEVVQIGTVKFNTRINKIIQLLEEDTTKFNYLSDRSSIWYSVDPLAEKFPNYSPYVYCYNNPINYYDPDGRQGMAGPRMSYWTEHLSPQQKQEAGKLALRYFTPVEDLYGVWSGKDFDGESYNRAAAAGWAVLGIVPDLKSLKAMELLKIPAKELKVAMYAGKHFAPVKMLWKDIIESTLKDPAKFKDSKKYIELTTQAWEKGKNVTNGKAWKVFESTEVIGATEGKETKYMRVELTESTKELHSSPISKEQYQKLTKTK